MNFTHEDFESQTWSKIKVWVSESLFELRSKLESDISHDQATKIRGAICQLKAFQELDKPEPKTY